MKAAAPSLMMNSESAASWPKRIETLSLSSLCSKQSSKSRVAGVASMKTQILPGDALAVDLVAVGVEQEPLPADDLFHLRLDDDLEPAVVVGALLDAAVRVAEHLADVIDAEGDAAARERRAYPTRVGQLLREA